MKKTQTTDAARETRSLKLYRYFLRGFTDALLGNLQGLRSRNTEATVAYALGVQVGTVEKRATIHIKANRLIKIFQDATMALDSDVKVALPVTLNPIPAKKPLTLVSGAKPAPGRRVRPCDLPDVPDSGADALEDAAYSLATENA